MNRVSNFHPCAEGCVCARHRGQKRAEKVCPVCGTIFSVPPSLVAKKKFCSPECNLIDYSNSTERWTSKSETIKKGHARKSPEARVLHGKRISETRKRLGIYPSDEIRAVLADCAVRNWQGGQAGDDFAAVLCPSGFVREHRVYYGEPIIKVGIRGLGRLRRSFNLDFAHVEAKVNIELDGAHHKTTKKQDGVRDSILRDLGWRVIRINHA